MKDYPKLTVNVATLLDNGEHSSIGNSSAMLESLYRNTRPNRRAGLAVEDRLQSQKRGKKPTQSSNKALK